MDSRNPATFTWAHAGPHGAIGDGDHKARRADSDYGDRCRSCGQPIVRQPRTKRTS